jgi:hypothetical protein
LPPSDGAGKKQDLTLVPTLMLPGLAGIGALRLGRKSGKEPIALA